MRDCEVEAGPRATIVAAQIALALVIIGLGLAMLFGANVMVRAFDNLGLGSAARLLFGMLEAIAGLSLLLPRAAPFGAMILVLLCAGASGTVILNAVSGPLVAASDQPGYAAPYIERTTDRDRERFVMPHDVRAARGHDI